MCLVGSVCANLHGATTNQTQQYSNDGNNQQYVDDATAYKAAEEAYSPNDNKNNGNDIQQISHGGGVELGMIEGREKQ